MNLSAIDFAIIALYFAIIVPFGLFFARRAKKKTVSMPLGSIDHQSQLPATPLVATISVTARGVSAANVVATIEVPASHQGSDRPATKNSEVSLPARRV